MRSKMVQVQYIVFSSGALGGLSLVGSWQALEEDRGSIRGIKGLSGCSMGSIIATLVSIGFTANELKIVSSNVKYEDYADHSFISLSESYGIETGRRLMRLVDRLIRYKTGYKHMKFKDHWRLTGRKLWINTTHVESCKCEYYSVETSPDMLITDAIRRSISIPFLFAAVRTESGTYVDGACYDPVPTHMFPADKTLCLNVRNNKKSAEENNSTLSVVSDLFMFSATLFGGMLTELNTLRFKSQEDQGYKMIYIETGIGSLSFSLTPGQIKEVIDIGYQRVKGCLI
jgi:NTE family protein